MIEAYVGQPGKVSIKMFDADGNETQRYDTMTGISYTIEGADAVMVVDTDANPFDAELTFSRPHAEGDEPSKVVVEFDGDPDDEVRHIRLESDEITVVDLPPDEPGEAVSAVLMVELHPVEV